MDSRPIIYSKNAGVKKQDNYELNQLLKDEIHGYYFPKGIIFMFCSCLFKTLTDILSLMFLNKNPKISYFQILSFTSIFLLIISISCLLIFKIDILNKNIIKKQAIFPLFLIPHLGITSLTILVYSSTNMNLSDLNFCFSLFPAFIILFSYLLFRESLNSFDYLSMILCSVSTILMMKPEIIFNVNHTTSNSFSLILIIISALFKSFEIILIRSQRDNFHFLVLPLVYSIMGLIIFSLAMFSTTYTYPVLTIYEGVFLFVIGLSTFCYLLFMTLALKNEKAGNVSLINYFQFAMMLISVSLINKYYNIDQLIGSFFIICLITINLFVKISERKGKLMNSRV